MNSSGRMQTLFLRKGSSGRTMAAIFIHDLIPTVLSAVLPDTSGFSVIDANKKGACCQGCFRCWLASPGQCVMKDDLQTIGVQIGSCEKVIILSRCCYGGFSPGVKKVLDRAISLSLPFFTYRLRGLSRPIGSIWGFHRHRYSFQKSQGF